MKISNDALPSAWRALPQWVRAELAEDVDYFEEYDALICTLARHNASMQPVWSLLYSKRGTFQQSEAQAHAAGLIKEFDDSASDEELLEIFAGVLSGSRAKYPPKDARPWGPVRSLLVMLHAAASDVDPGLGRSSADRDAIATSIAVRVSELTRQMERLATASPFGIYPGVVASAMGCEARECAQAALSSHFDVAKRHIDERLHAAGVAEDVRRAVINDLRALQYEIETQTENVYLDPRPSMQSLADAVREWSELCTWGRNDVIRFIASSLRSWLGRHQPVATQILATAVLGDEISESTVRNAVRGSGLMRRAKKVKAKVQKS